MMEQGMLTWVNIDLFLFWNPIKYLKKNKIFKVRGVLNMVIQPWKSQGQSKQPKLHSQKKVNLK